ncbi:MAG TPA: hypothetical protein VFV87_05825, partial [Pirellulaceae bacterium]|nr:hypothetical protein [Pirellulaceae bacterium]
MNRHQVIVALILLVVAARAPEAAYAESPELRWVYLQQNLQVKENLPKIEEILRRAKAAGSNGVVL